MARYALGERKFQGANWSGFYWPICSGERIDLGAKRLSRLPYWHNTLCRLYCSWSTVCHVHRQLILPGCASDLTEAKHKEVETWPVRCGLMRSDVDPMWSDAVISIPPPQALVVWAQRPVGIDFNWSGGFARRPIDVPARVVSSEISGNFPRKISGNLFQSFRKFPEIC